MTTARQIIAPRYGEPEVLEVTRAAVPPAGAGQVTIEVRAAGVNPADYKSFSGVRSSDPANLPIHPGFEVAGVLTAIGADTEIGSGGGAVGDEVLAFRVRGGYASSVTVPAKDVFAKPAALDFAEAANLLLVGTTAAEMLHVVGVTAGETVLVHGASGAVGVSLLQQAAFIGARVIGTSSSGRFDVVRSFGAEPVEYGSGLAARIRALGEPVVAALDCVGTAEAVEVSLELVADRDRIVTIAAADRASRDGFHAIGGAMPASAAYRDAARARLIGLAADGRLVVPVARTWPLEQAAAALTELADGHPGGKFALVP